MIKFYNDVTCLKKCLPKEIILIEFLYTTAPSFRKRFFSDITKAMYMYHVLMEMAIFFLFSRLKEHLKPYIKVFDRFFILLTSTNIIV
jgi:hypothetical protein